MNQPKELLDRKPPADLRIEIALLSCVITNPKIFTKVRELLTKNDFTDDDHRVVFSVFCDCLTAHEPTEARFVLPRLRKALGADRAREIIADLVKQSATDWQAYTRKLSDLGKKRRALQAAIEVIQAVHDDRPTDALLRTIIQTKSSSKTTVLSQVAQQFAEAQETSRANGRTISIGISELDHSLGGGVEPGEFMILAARPSHGKSAIALQAIHFWTDLGLPCIFISEEMSAMSIGKRAAQFASDIPMHDWRKKSVEFRGQIAAHFKGRAECYIVEQCRSAENAAEHIRVAAKESGVKIAVVDYVQLLSAPGQKRYEQVSNVSVHLRQVANETGVVLFGLCQLNREIEHRTTFVPKMSDIRETGQLEQDADIIVFGVWPHRIDPKRPTDDYTLYVAKNRNRPINKAVISCKFDPSRQMFSTSQPDNYDESFDAFAAEE